jgi:hypothetical protein
MERGKDFRLCYCLIPANTDLFLALQWQPQTSTIGGLQIDAPSSLLNRIQPLLNHLAKTRKSLQTQKQWNPLLTLFPVTPQTPLTNTVLASQLTNNRRRMKPSANRIQHLSTTLQQLQIQDIPHVLLKSEQ